MELEEDIYIRGQIAVSYAISNILCEKLCVLCG
jgi:hypothetical protein